MSEVKIVCGGAFLVEIWRYEIDYEGEGGGVEPNLTNHQLGKLGGREVTKMTSRDFSVGSFFFLIFTRLVSLFQHSNPECD